MALQVKSVVVADDKKADGVWVDYPDEDGVRFRLRYLGGEDYQDHVAERMEKARRGRRSIPAEIQRRIVTDALVKFVVRGWEGVEEEPGKPFEFTKDNCKWFLDHSDKVRQFVINESNNLDNFISDDEGDGPEGELKSGAPVDAAVGSRPSASA